MRFCYALVIGAVCAVGCTRLGRSSERINVRVEVIRFSEDDMHTWGDDGVCSWTSEIEFKIVSPREYQDVRPVERWRGYTPGGTFTTVGNVFDATIDSRVLAKTNIGRDGRILGYTLPYVGLEQLQVMSQVGKVAEQGVGD